MGLDAWVSGGNYYRPVNGGRVVKWVDSAGAIKTSVNMMPPEAHQINARGTGTCDATGTTNWSSAYQPVFGNKRVGSDLITNGTFASDTAWTKETGVTIGSGKVHMQGSSTHSFNQSVSSLVIGREYKATYTISEYSSGGARLYVDGGGGRPYHEANGTYSYSFIATATSHSVGLGGKSGVTDNLKVDDFSLYEIDPPEAQAEVAKTFLLREFGNGKANGNANYPDASMVNTAEDIGYVMDDGSTSMTVGQCSIDSSNYFMSWGGSSTNQRNITFIGTGISIKSGYNIGTSTAEDNIYHIAQNLPYGSHIYHKTTDTSHKILLDGVELVSGNHSSNYWKEVTFYQPKKPPIPEDACVIADYMLMADHVNKTSHTNGVSIAKGVRLLDSSRDIFHDTSSGSMLLNNACIPDGYPFRNYMNSGSGAKLSKISAFGTSFGIDAMASIRGKPQVAGSDVLHTDRGSHVHIDSAVTLGNNLFGWQAESGQDGGFFRFEIATPTHTSHHYQTFETPFLHELVGGDRNMEQTNLVCSPDGKSWDQITRDTSYIGDIVLTSQSEQNAWITADTTTSTVTALDKLRGSANLLNAGNKDWAIAYDRYICLVDGFYEFRYQGLTIGSSDEVGHRYIKINGSTIFTAHRPSTSSSDYDTFNHAMTHFFKRGDYIQMYGRSHGDVWGNFQIRRV